MGYTHYWYLNPHGNQEKYDIAKKIIAEILKNSPVSLANGVSEAGSKPVFDKEIWFNGVAHGSHETFWLPATLKELLNGKYIQKDDAGRVFSSIKTAYKPYDTVVTACLTVLKNAVGEDASISSDGEVQDFQAGMKLAQ